MRLLGKRDFEVVMKDFIKNIERSMEYFSSN